MQDELVGFGCEGQQLMLCKVLRVYPGCSYVCLLSVNNFHHLPRLGVFLCSVAPPYFQK